MNAIHEISSCKIKCIRIMPLVKFTEFCEIKTKSNFIQSICPQNASEYLLYHPSFGLVIMIGIVKIYDRMLIQLFTRLTRPTSFYFSNALMHLLEVANQNDKNYTRLCWCNFFRTCTVLDDKIRTAYSNSSDRNGITSAMVWLQSSCSWILARHGKLQKSTNNK